MRRRLKHVSYEDRLRKLELCILEKAPGRPSSNLPVAKGCNKRAGEGLFKRTCSDSAPFLEVFKAWINGALRNLISWKVSLSMAGRLEQDDF